LAGNVHGPDGTLEFDYVPFEILKSLVANLHKFLIRHLFFPHWLHPAHHAEFGQIIG
jgi:hypothetical protein